jgi:hypothetical protein
MANFASTDVTVTLVRSNILRGSPGGLRFNNVKIQFGDGALTYAAGGVPVPGPTAFGLLKRLDAILLYQNGVATIGYVWSYDPANNKLKGMEEVAAASSTALAEIAAGAIAAQTLYGYAIGW